MLCEDIRHVALQLGVLADRVSQDDWTLISRARRHLHGLADQVEQVEKHFVPAPRAHEKEVSQ